MIAAALTLALALQAAPADAKAPAAKAPVAKAPAKAADRAKSSVAKSSDARSVTLAKATPGEFALAEAMQRGFTACALQVTERKHLTAANAATLTKAGLTLSAAPPEDVKTVAAQMFKTGTSFAQVTAPGAAVWVIGSSTVPACKVTVAGTKDVLGARAEIDRRFRGAKAWSHDPARSFTRDGVSRQAYILNKDLPGRHMMMLVDGPTALADEGKGIQAIMTIGFIKPEAK